jgi:hypothetical protein
MREGSAIDPVHCTTWQAWQAAMPLGPHDPIDPMMLKVAMADKDGVWILWQALISES